MHIINLNIYTKSLIKLFFCIITVTKYEMELLIAKHNKLIHIDLPANSSPNEEDVSQKNGWKCIIL